jgi:NADH dehydrogenase [ubiquinone] 1 alpha subcomplex assembly factor 1
MIKRKCIHRLLLILISLLLLTTMAHAELLDFTNPLTANALRVVNDNVMGGVSKSRFTFDPEGTVFEGEVSLENGGGFASVRSPILIPECTSALNVTIRGDEKQVKLVLRTDNSSRSPLYQADFTTTREWQTHRFMPTDFKASFRGRAVNAPELVFSSVLEIGLLIANQQAGTFRLQLKNIQSISEKSC